MIDDNDKKAVTDAVEQQDTQEACPQHEDTRDPVAKRRLLDATVGWIRRGVSRRSPVTQDGREPGESTPLDGAPEANEAAAPGSESANGDQPHDDNPLAGALSWLARLFSFEREFSPDAPPESEAESDKTNFHEPPPSTVNVPETEHANAEKGATQPSRLRRVANLFSRSKDHPTPAEPTNVGQDATVDEPSEPQARGLLRIQARVVEALVGGIRMISAEEDRDEIIRWFVNAREILAGGGTRKAVAKALYASVDTKRFAQLLGHSALTGIRNYKASNLPLSLKVALPVTVVGAAFLGAHGAGVAAFGGAVGLPVVLLLFLGTAGATAVVEAFIKDRSVRDPLTKLLLALVALDVARRAKTELVAALRAEATIPERAPVPADEAALLDYLMAMDPTAFERHVMSYFQDDGYPVGVTPKTNDFGVDGYVVHPDGIIVVQCKRYSTENPVGRPEVQQFKGVIEEQHALRGFIVTTSRFTREAVESAAKSNRIVLVDGKALIEWHKSGATVTGRLTSG